jgi:tetratricopeptide (TPR) repeat protein
LLVRILGVEQTKFDAARSWLLQALASAARDSVVGPDAFLAAAAMASRQVHPTEAIDFARRAVAKLDELGETDDNQYAFALDQLAAALDEGGHSGEAVPIYRKAIALNQQLGGPDNPALFNDFTNLSLALIDSGDDRGAVDAARRGLALAQQWAGVLSADTLPAAWLNLGAAYQASNQNPQAVLALEAARAGYQGLPGDQRDSLAIVEADLALAHKDLGKKADAMKEIQHALAIYRDLGESGGNEYASASLTLGDLLSDDRKCGEAVDVLGGAIAILRKNAPGDPAWVIGLSGMGQCMRELGRTAEAVPAVEEALVVLATSPHAKHIEAELRFQLARDLHDLHRDPDRAARLATDARALYVAEDANVYAKEIAFIDEVVGGWR